ncbi:ParB N-terminal domain-containing protein, partial [Acinetobacter baumannii]|uniref:ParB N-terminal domain-containing protein n=1 Tax=Acinetobacter baumannii TaxID=470 RepID=UPI0039F0F0DE
MKLRQQIRLADCVSNPFNPREFYSPEAIDALAVKLKRDGQYEAIKVTKNHRFPGKYVIIDGEYRSRAKKSLGDEFIDGEIFPDLSDADLYL